MMHPTSQVKVLIAERIVDLAEVIARNLRNRGYEIVGIVNSGEQAIELATVTTPDIVLMDIPLPGEIDSITAAWKIYSEIHCPVIYMAGCTDNIGFKRAQLANPYGCLIKPFSADELRDAIESALWERWFEQATYSQWISELSSCNADEQFLAVLSAASTFQPMPRILFESGVLKIYIEKPSGADTLNQLCSTQAFPYSYQIYAWASAGGRYNLYNYG